MPDFSLVSLQELVDALRTNSEVTTGPANSVEEVTPNDDFDLPNGVCRAFFVSGAGVVRFRDPAGNIVNITSGESQYHPIKVQRVFATDTTATGIIAMY